MSRTAMLGRSRHACPEGLRLLVFVSLFGIGCSGDSDTTEKGEPPPVVRGLGQEPGWTLEVRTDSLHFSGDYGQRTVSVPRSVVTVDSTAGRTVYRSDRLDVVVEAEPCTDVMSGDSFSHTVTVTVGDETYRGCCRVLR